MLASLATALSSAAVAAAEEPSQGYLEYQDQMSHLAVLFWIAVVSMPFLIVAMLFLVVWLFTRKLDTDDSGKLKIPNRQKENSHDSHRIHKRTDGATRGPRQPGG